MCRINAGRFSPQYSQLVIWSTSVAFGGAAGCPMAGGGFAARAHDPRIGETCHMDGLRAMAPRFGYVWNAWRQTCRVPPEW
jgi:hypothetical protein